MRRKLRGPFFRCESRKARGAPTDKPMNEPMCLLRHAETLMASLDNQPNRPNSRSAYFSWGLVAGWATLSFHTEVLMMALNPHPNMFCVYKSAGWQIVIRKFAVM